MPEHSFNPTECAVSRRAYDVTAIINTSWDCLGIPRKRGEFLDRTFLWFPDNRLIVWNAVCLSSCLRRARQLASIVDGEGGTIIAAKGRQLLQHPVPPNERTTNIRVASQKVKKTAKVLCVRI